MADLSQSILRRLRDVRDNPRGVLEQLADQLNNFNKGRVAEINPSEAGYRNLTMKERSRLMTQGALDNIGGGGMGALGIIKTKGGNWLTGSVENALARLKRIMDPELEGYARRGQNLMPHEAADVIPKIALNNWIEGTLAKYVKRDMATEGDPVRKLAEQGILHIPEEHLPMGLSSHAYGERGTRAKMKMPLQGVGQSPMAMRWEDSADSALNLKPASYYQSGVEKSSAEPWILNATSDTPIFQVQHSTAASDLGFNHLTDELANALNPESGLPRHLLLTPEQMQQLGMEKAVRHVDAINKWRAAQKAEANAKLAQSPAVRMVREYAENNPKGLRWVEIKKPSTEGWTEMPDGWSRPDPNMPGFHETRSKNDFGIPELSEQLKYEGDTMGHCVGGYCDDVASGRSRIFSLRDAKGEPHVTIETRPGDETQSIVQIKGKQNLKPKDEYLPFVQDFVRNHPEGGKWGDIGDLNNAGLYRHHVSKYPESVKDLGEYASKEDIENWVSNNVKPTPGFAQGGSVQVPDYFDDLNAFLRR